MKILMVNLEKGWRGGERQTFSTASELHQHGCQVTLLARKGGALYARARQAGLTVKEIGTNAGLAVYLLMHRNAFDIVHVQTAGALTMVALVKPLLRARVVYTRRTSFPIKSRTHLKWNRVDAFAAISAAAAELPRSLGIEVSIIPSAMEFVPADAEQITQFAEDYELSGKYVIATCAAFSPEKDPLTCVRAINELWKKRQDFVFLHFGADGREFQATEALVHELGLEQVYRIVGFKQNIEDMYRLMHVFLLTSMSEGMGSSVLEAFLYGATVVSTKVGGVPDLIGDDRGILCEVGDYQSIAAACDTLLENEALRTALATEAEKLVLQEYNVPLMAERYVALYRATLGQTE
ncbi:glycosyltransferase family 4 protein [Paenalcaligenes niemegkensis]|uniref:glycosyltransferase family 4 protein n=1 Tax=Paenalcaligenes niemegkensis TaxID=2895469 RepID=UPI001EE7A311|nr:glycosyltransferase family 4 protein [Paenalcaligenes niemegkensis]MCQ9617715.1 glycosyltransferase family 4 protein [Paenalcaligenes niemegkensis]